MVHSRGAKDKKRVYICSESILTSDSKPKNLTFAYIAPLR